MIYGSIGRSPWRTYNVYLYMCESARACVDGEFRCFVYIRLLEYFRGRCRSENLVSDLGILLLYGTA